MTDDGRTFWEVLGQPGREDFLRSLRERVLEQLRDFAVTNRIRAGRHERTDARQTHRNGHRERPPPARLGALELKVPQWRQGNYFPSFLEPRRPTEQALTAVLREAWIGGRATRKGDDPVQALGMTGISKSQGSAPCRDIDARVDSFLNRSIEGEWPYLWLDATYLNGRKGGRVGSVAALIAGGANQDGRRELLGLGPGDSEAQGFWVEFPRSLRQRGSLGVRLVIAEAHAGLKAAIRQVVTASWQRCRVRFPRNRLAAGRCAEGEPSAGWHPGAPGLRPAGCPARPNRLASGGRSAPATLPESRRADRSGRGRCLGASAGSHRASGEHPLHQPFGAPQQGG